MGKKGGYVEGVFPLGSQARGIYVKMDTLYIFNDRWAGGVDSRDEWVKIDTPFSNCIESLGLAKNQ